MSRICSIAFMADLQAVVAGCDMAAIAERIRRNILRRLVEAGVKSDHLGMAQTLHSADPNVKERRLFHNLYSVSQLLEDGGDR